MRRCPQCKTEYEDAVAFCGADGTITVQVQAVDDHDERLGKTLGDYIVAARIADGAMGRVYEGRHPQTKARVAIKVLHEEVARDGVAVERFKREYETAEEFDHPHIVKVLEFGPTDDGSFFMTMEYLAGSELSHALREDGPMKPARAVRVISQLASALDHAHSFGVIHRDLKPDNVFLVHAEGGDHVKVLDFGSVKLQMETGPKLTAIGTTLGSPYYMSPEQAMGKLDVDQRTDVFSVAAIAWEMATGQVAFEGRSVAEILMKIVNEDPAPASSLAPSYPPSYDDALLAGVSKDKTKRPNGTGALADSLVHALGLPDDHTRWAAVSQAEVTAAVDGATPSPSRPGVVEPAPENSGSQNFATESPLGTPMRTPHLSMSDAPPRSASGLNPMWLVLGAGVFVALGLVLYLVLG